MNELLEKVKDDFAKGRGSESWGRYSLLFSISLEDIDEIAIRFAKAVAEKSLENAKDSFNDYQWHGPHSQENAEKSITNPQNIPL